MPVRRRYHVLVYEKGAKHPDLFMQNPLYWYPSFEAAQRAAQEILSEHDGDVRVDILDDAHVVQQVRTYRD